MKTTRRKRRMIRHKRVRARAKGTAERPRISVFRSHQHIFAQIIDDEKGITLASVHDKELKSKKGNARERAHAVGMLLAERAKEKKVSRAVFDRSGYHYHGVVKALAEGAREGGLLL